MLYRPLQDGKQFEKLIPKPPGNKTASGKGDTNYSIKEMEAMVNEFHPQMKEVANLLATSSLQSTLEAVKDFCYNTFQYKADGDDQLLRSPSYAFWIDRKTGIDCKSYSIIASCILTNLGINHYIRKIKQPGYAPSEYTHVYVVVPMDQETNNLKNGYYCIDGTLYEDDEPAHIETSDILMLNHYRLNAPAQGLNAGYSLSNLTSLNNFITQLGCIGGSAYTEAKMKTYLAGMEKYFNGLITKINQAVIDKNDVAFAEAVNEYFGVSKLGVIGSKKKLSEGWNICSSNVIKVIIKAFSFYSDYSGQALTAWLEDNFVKDAQISLTKTYKTDLVIAQNGMGATSLGVTVDEPLYYYEPKAKTINAFEITPYVANISGTTTSFDPIKYLSGLLTTLASFEPASNGNNGNNPGGGLTDPNTGGPPETKTAGFGVLGWVLLAVGVGIAVKGFSELKTAKS